MFDSVQHYCRLGSLQNQKDRVRAKYKCELEQARRDKKSKDELHEIGAEEFAELDLIDDEIAQLQYTFLVRRAENLLIPIPEFDTDSPSWRESHITGKWRLTNDALHSLRMAIRKEQTERREHWQSWLTLIIGLIGALIGLASVL
jgi:hypothetical protein